MKINIYGYMNLVMAMVIVGSSVAVGKVMISSMPIFLASELRFVLASVLLLAFLFKKEGGLPRLSRKSMFIIAGQSLCGSFLFTICLLYGLSMASPASAGIITSTTPAFMALICWALLGERPGRAGVAGIVLSVAGIFLLGFAGGGDGYGGCSNILGIFLVLAAVVFESLFLILRKFVSEPLSPLAASTLVSIFGMIYFLPVAVGQGMVADWGGFTLEAWISVAYYAVFITFLAYLFWFTGVVLVPGYVAGVFTSIMPVSALVFCAVILGEDITLAHAGGLLLVLAGIVVISLRPGENTLKPADPATGANKS